MITNAEQDAENEVARKSRMAHMEAFSHLIDVHRGPEILFEINLNSTLFFRK